MAKLAQKMQRIRVQNRINPIQMRVQVNCLHLHLGALDVQANSCCLQFITTFHVIRLEGLKNNKAKVKFTKFF